MTPCPGPPVAFVPELSVMISLAWPLPVMQLQLRDLRSVLIRSREHSSDALLSVMTVSYSGDVGNASVFGCFNKILGRWRGSVYKLVFKELLAFISIYLVINLTYRLVLVRNSSCDIEFQSCVRWKQYRETFESLRGYCYENVKSIPLMFVLGFYVSLVVTRYE